ncbi:unnamed protein product [Callosobruchus maculatus]|uniref:DUF4097 domain-containing protein n=1 Tax=Callosobruchus maculatus TaxID=64391 RepID=A0A653C1F9_CALMS|nr:unnamed protein product [Callosobruchus maculatus]
MTTLTKLLLRDFKPRKLLQLKTFATYVEKELEVPTFCDVHIDLPYSVTVKPLNVHKYHNCDKLIIKIDDRCKDSLQYDVDGNQVKIDETVERKEDDVMCYVKAPVKANLYINSKKDINIGYFHGDKLYATSQEGDVNVDRFQGNSANVMTANGNIRLNDFIQAANISASIQEKGSIITGRMQGLNLILKTNTGNINVESAYSHESHFEIVNGNLELQNAHRSCKIFIHEGDINLAGFDGKLKLVLERGKANIHLFRISEEESEINILDGSLKLRLADACQDYVQFLIKSETSEISENVKSTINNSGNVLELIPDINADSSCIINCQGHVFVESASWQDMIKLRMQKRE